MGRKRGRHVTLVERSLIIPILSSGTPPELKYWAYYVIVFKASKCRHAKRRYAYIWAADELDAYNKFKAASYPKHFG